jgi:hypothetical protein
MPRWRERVRLEDGLKLDLNELIAKKLVRLGAFSTSRLNWWRRMSGETIASVKITADMTDLDNPWLRLELGALDQRIALDFDTRHFGGRQWYFRCPRTGRRASVLWKPPGSPIFASRHAWGRQVAYGSQFETPRDRAISAAQDIRYQLGGKDYVAIGHFQPPKPKGMHWRTYDAKLERCKNYESICLQYFSGFLARLKK